VWLNQGSILKRCFAAGRPAARCDVSSDSHRTCPTRGNRRTAVPDQEPLPVPRGRSQDRGGAPRRALSGGRRRRARFRQVVPITADRVAREPGPIGAIVFPAYDRGRDARPSLAPISVVSAAEALARAFSYPTSDTRGLVAGVFRLAQRIACYRLDYRDATAAAAELAQPRRLSFRSGSNARGRAASVAGAS
jgi:hypothetical protein